MNKLKYVKLENEDGSYSSSIPLAVDSDYVDVNGETLTNKLNNKAEKSQINNLQSQINGLASGSPLAASSVAGMTDTTRVYVNTTDGNWYYYNGSAWIIGGVYQSTSLNFLYDTLLLEDGFINSIGLITANANFKHTKYLPINIISTFQIKGTQGSLVYAYYDKDLKYLGGLAGNNSSDVITSFENIPENTMYIRFTKSLNKTFNINFNEYIQNFLELYIENYPKIKMLAGYINQTGGIVSGGAQFEYSENYIPISMIEAINLPYISGASTLAFYDKELNYISSIYGPSGSGSLTSLNDIVIPNNAIYVRYTRSIKYGDSTSFGNIKLKNIYYLPEVLKDISIKIINQLESHFDIKNVLYGKKIVAIGDSMTRGHSVAIEDGWLAKIAQRNNMTYVNLGINGTFLSNHVWNNYQPVVNRINEIPEDSDYVIIFAGTNDITSSSIQVGEENSTDTTTIYGALNSICQQLLTRFPNKKVCFITPYIRNQYKEKCLQVEEAFKNALRNNGGIPYFDNFQSGGIDFSNETQASSLTLNDGLHLNVAGMNWVSYKYENFIKGL